MNWRGRLVQYFFKIWYHFTLGVGFVSLSFIVLGVSDKIMNFIGISGSWWKVGIIIAGAFVLAWQLGAFLDRYVKAAQHMEREAIARSEVWKKVFSDMKDINDKLDAIILGSAGKGGAVRKEKNDTLKNIESPQEKRPS